MRPSEGTQLGNRYTLTSRIAVGGMGEVWKGVDSVLGREVAAKILKEEYLSDSTFLARFRAEAQNMGRVSDPGIAGVYDYGDEQGSPYLVMEYVPGEPLSTIIERSAPLSEADTLSIVSQAAQALGAAHRAGVVHRDIKPGNILMTPDFRVKITDFGIARVTDQAPLTKTGQVMGTAQYLAPEQATGKGSGPGSDLYALGIIAYEALAGQRPFTGDSQVSIAIAQVNQQHPPLPTTVSEPVRRFVDALLEKKPERRPDDAMAVARAAEAISAGDIAGAEAILPQMRHGNAASEALTQVFNGPEPVPSTQVMQSADATRVYSADGQPPGPGQPPVPGEQPGEDGEELGDSRTKKGRWLIWVLAIVALIAVGALLWYFLGRGGTEPAPAPSTSATTSAPAEVEINVDDYIGQSESSATNNLEQLGLKVTTRSIESSRTAGTVADVGEAEGGGYTFTEGDTVTLYISSGPAEEPEPPARTRTQAPPTDSSSGSGSGSGSSANAETGDDSEETTGTGSGSNSEASTSGEETSAATGGDEASADPGATQGAGENASAEAGDE